MRRLVRCLVKVGFVVLLFATLSKADISDGLVAYWSFDDGTATDNSGHANDGTIYGAVSVLGVVGQALQFDGVDDWVEVDDSDDLDGTSEFSIALWVKFGSFGSPGHCGPNCMPIISKYYNYDTNPDLSSYYLFETAGDHFALAFFDAAGGLDGYPVPHTIALGEWFHLAFTFDQGFVQAYINGEEALAEQYAVSSINNSAQSFKLGAWYHVYNSTYKTFDGTMDEVRVYNRVLSEGEIRRLVGCHGFTGTFCDDFDEYTSISDPSFEETWTAMFTYGIGEVSLEPHDGGQALRIYNSDHEQTVLKSVETFPFVRTVECDVMNTDFGQSQGNDNYGATLRAWTTPDGIGGNPLLLRYTPYLSAFRARVEGEYYVLGSDIQIDLGQWYRLKVEIEESTVSFYYDTGAGFEYLGTLDHALPGEPGPIVLSQQGYGSSEAFFDNVTVTTPPFCEGFEGLFCDGFDDGVVTDWQTLTGSCDWVEGNGILSASNTGQEQWCIQSVGDQSWADYSVETKVRGNSGVDKVLVFRIQDADNFYAVNLRSDYPEAGTDELTFDKMVDGVYQADLATVSWPSESGLWYQLQVNCVGSQFQIFVDDELALEYTDGDYPSDGIGLACWTGIYGECDISFDDVAVTELSSGPALAIVSPSYEHAIEAGGQIEITWESNPQAGIEEVKLYYQTPQMPTPIPLLGLGGLPVEQGTYSWTCPDNPMQDILITATGHNAAGDQVAQAEAPASISAYVKHLLLSIDGYRVLGWEEVDGADHYELSFEPYDNWTSLPVGAFVGTNSSGTNFITLTVEAMNAMPANKWTVTVSAYSGSTLLENSSLPLLVGHVAKVEPYSSDPTSQPVMLVHGAFSDAGNWYSNELVDDLMGRGYRFWTFQYPNVGDIRESAWMFKHALNAVILETHPEYTRLPVIAHSLGGLVIRTYLEGLGREPLGAQVSVDDNVSDLITVGSPHQGVWFLTGYYLHWASDFLLGQVWPWFSGEPEPANVEAIRTSPIVEIYLPPDGPFLESQLNNNDDHQLNQDVRYLFNRGCVRLTTLPGQSTNGQWAGYTAMALALGKANDGLILRKDAIPPEEMWDDANYVRSRSRTLSHSQLARAGLQTVDDNVSLFDSFLRGDEVGEDPFCYCCVELLAKYAVKLLKPLSIEKGGAVLIDPANSTPVAGALVTAIPREAYEQGLTSNYVFQSEKDGSVSVPYLLDDDYVLRVQAPGFDTSTYYFRIDTLNRQVNQTMYLNPQAEALDLMSPTVELNHGELFTTDSIVCATISCDGAVEFRVSAIANLESEPWQTMTDSVLVTVPGGSGPRVVNVEFRDSLNNLAGPVWDLITLGDDLNCQLAVSSAPSGAAIVINGMGSGKTTPHIFDSLAPGSFTVSVELAGYKSDSTYRTISLASGQQAAMSFELQASLPPETPELRLPYDNQAVCGSEIEFSWSRPGDQDSYQLFSMMVIVDDTISPSYRKVYSGLNDTVLAIGTTELEGDKAYSWYILTTDAEGAESVRTGWRQLFYYGPDCEFICGDANADELANITDAVYLIAYIFNDGAEPVPYEAGDANCDTIVNITDAVYLISYIFAGGSPPCDTDNDGAPDC